MHDYGCKIQNSDYNNAYASALMEMGDCMKQMDDLKYDLDDDIKQNYIEPMRYTQKTEIKEVMYHRKKMNSRKLDYDYKKQNGAKEQDILDAEEKFEESLNLAQNGMYNLVNGSNIEHSAQLTCFAKSLLDYHKKCAEVLQNVTDALHAKSKGSLPYQPNPLNSQH